MHRITARKLSMRYVRKTVLVAALIALLAFPPLSNFFISPLYAAGLTQYHVLINNSQADAAGVTYTFNFTTSATTAIGEIDLQVCTTPSGTCSAPSGFNTGTPTLQSSNIAGSSITTTGSTANLFKLNVGTPATQSTQTMALVFTGVHNPTAPNTTYYVRATTKDGGLATIDSTTAAFAVLDTGSISVSATVDPNFTFTVTRAVSGSIGAGSGTKPINVSSTTDNSIPFGTLNTTTASVAAHDITITTNAANGYQVTASQSAQPGTATLTSGSNIIDSFTQAGGTNASPTSWSDPTGNANTQSGYFAYTTNDTSLCTGTTSRFNNTQFAGLTTTGGEVACNTQGVSSETTRVGWILGIDAKQPAGNYTGTIILVATPTY